VVKNWPSSTWWHVSIQLKASHWYVHSSRSVPRPPPLHILLESLYTTLISTFIPKTLLSRKLRYLKSPGVTSNPEDYIPLELSAVQDSRFHSRNSSNDHRDICLSLLLSLLSTFIMCNASQHGKLWTVTIFPACDPHSPMPTITAIPTNQHVQIMQLRKSGQHPILLYTDSSVLVDLLQQGWGVLPFQLILTQGHTNKFSAL